MFSRLFKPTHESRRLVQYTVEIPKGSTFVPPENKERPYFHMKIFSPEDAEKPCISGDFEVRRRDVTGDTLGYDCRLLMDCIQVDRERVFGSIDLQISTRGENKIVAACLSVRDATGHTDLYLYPKGEHSGCTDRVRLDICSPF